MQKMKYRKYSMFITTIQMQYSEFLAQSQNSETRERKKMHMQEMYNEV